jgi:hypothetical protein
MVFEQLNWFPVFYRITAIQRWQVTRHCQWSLYGDRSNEFTHKSRQTLGPFAEVRKATITFIMSVHPSAWNNSAPTERTFKFDTSVFFENLSRKLKFSLKCDQINGHLTWRSVYICDHISFSSSQNDKCFRQKLYRKSKHAFCVQYLFFPKLRRLCDNVEKYCRPGQATDGNMARHMHSACWIPKATNTHSVYVILGCFSTAIMVTHTRPDVSFYVHCLSWSYSMYLQTEFWPMSRHKRHICCASRPAVHLLHTLRFSSSTTQYILPAINATEWHNRCLSWVTQCTHSVSKTHGFLPIKTFRIELPCRIVYNKTQCTLYVTLRCFGTTIV